MNDTTKNAAAKAYAWIEARFAEGRNVWVQTYVKNIKVTPKVYASWKDSGGMFKLSDSGDLFIRRGNKAWDCIGNKHQMLVGLTAQ